MNGRRSARKLARRSRRSCASPRFPMSSFLSGRSAGATKSVKKFTNAHRRALEKHAALKISLEELGQGLGGWPRLCVHLNSRGGPSKLCLGGDVHASYPHPTCGDDDLRHACARKARVSWDSCRRSGCVYPQKAPAQAKLGRATRRHNSRERVRSLFAEPAPWAQTDPLWSAPVARAVTRRKESDANRFLLCCFLGGGHMHFV
jgi:hypothetical protein